MLGLGSMGREWDTDRKEAGGSPAVGWTGSQGTPVWSPPLVFAVHKDWFGVPGSGDMSRIFHGTIWNNDSDSLSNSVILWLGG